MKKRLQQQSAFSVLTMLVALCYVWLGTGGSFLHIHTYTGQQTRHTHSAAYPCSVSHAPQTVTLNAEEEKPDHCPVCDWQTLSIAQAILPFTFVWGVSSATDVSTASPRAPSAPHILIASRGPPASV